MPQLFAEPAAVAHIEWIPSVRVSSGVTVARWVRMLADGLYGLARSSPALRALAQRVVAGVDRRQHGWEPAIVRWARENIEAEVSLAEPATATVARGRGNRAAVIVALARALGLDADLVLARPVTEVPGERPPVGQELDDFAEVLVRFSGSGPKAPPLFVDPRWKHAPLGYLPPALDGARCLSLLGGWLETARSRSPDGRTVHLELRLEPDGSGKGRSARPCGAGPPSSGPSVHERLRGDDRQAAPGLRAALAEPPLSRRPPRAAGHRHRQEPGRGGRPALFLLQRRPGHPPRR